MPGTEPQPVEWGLIARLGKTRGLRGELYGRSDSSPEQLRAYDAVRLRRDGAFVGDDWVIEDVRPYKDGLVFRFRGVDSIDAAEPLEHAEMMIPLSARPTLPDREFYFSDLVGCEVFDRRTGRKAGTVTGWQEFGGPELLEIQPEGNGGIVWIPMVREICVVVDTAAKRIEVDPPEGLLELNEGGAAG